MSPRLRRCCTALLALLVLTNGCTMSTSSDPEPRGPLVAQDVIRLDLREAPTREEAGFAEGRNSIIFERVGDAIDVEIELPEGVLKLDAFGVVLAGPRGPDGQRSGEGVELVVVNRAVPDVAAVRDALVAEAPLLGLDATEVRDWAERVGGSASNQRAFEGRPSNPGISIETRPSSGGERWTINYSFSFDDAKA